MEWWNDIKQLSKVYLTTSEQMDRSGIVPAAVRAAGYRSEEEEDEEEADGSSIEEEDDEEEYEEAEDENDPHSAAPAIAGASHTQGATGTSASATKEEEVPAYTGGAASQGEVGPNGYLLEKKGESAQAAGEPSQDGLNRSASSAGKEKAAETEAAKEA